MRALSLLTRLAAVLGCLNATSAFADWRLQQDGESPSYIVFGPTNSNLNIGGVVLACEGAGDSRVLQLQIYLSADGPLLPKRATPRQLKGDPRAEIEVDGWAFPVGLLFASTYAVLADEADEMFPRLSEPLIDAMARGKIMILRFDLLAEPVGQPAAFDSEAVIALQPADGGPSVSAVRRCMTRPAPSMSVVAGDRDGLGISDPRYW